MRWPPFSLQQQQQQQQQQRRRSLARVEGVMKGVMVAVMIWQSCMLPQAKCW
jgi:hypothetical protein